MSDTVSISQKAAVGAKDNTFIGTQIITQGLTPENATQLAFNIFDQYFPKLKEEALQEVRKTVEEELRKIPINDILRPTAKIAVPTLQNASITEESNLREMYGKLLASDMNKVKRPNVHPAFVEIINQISADDAKLFSFIMKYNDSIPVAKVTFTFETKYLTNVLPLYYSPIFKDFDPWKASVSIENLSRLKLFQFFEGSVTNYNYDLIKQDPFIQKRFEFAKTRNPKIDLEIKVTDYALQTNDFGERFAKLCL